MMSVRNPITHVSVFLFFFLSCCSFPVYSSSTPYLSPNTFSLNYENMLNSFKIFTYPPTEPPVFLTRPESKFYTSLIDSSFLTEDPEQAHLFFIPFSASTSTRSLLRLVNSLRNEFPYWNRTLGADHFFISCEGFEIIAERNIVELKKNAVQISCFPADRNTFIPHKDITLPPLAESYAPDTSSDSTSRYLGYVMHEAVRNSSLIKELSNDPEFLVESELSDQLTFGERIGSSKFCLFEHGEGEISGISDAVRFGCVPVVITDRPIQDMPLMEVLRWQEMAVFVSLKDNNTAAALRRVIDRTCGGERYEEMKSSCVSAGQHFVWNEEPQPYDAFNMMMYQLWLKRHTIRYARVEFA